MNSIFIGLVYFNRKAKNKMNTMKTIKFLQIAILIFITIDLDAQETQDLGKRSYNEIKKMNFIDPCDALEDNTLTYCLEGDNKIIYLFKNYTLNGIKYLTAYSSPIDVYTAIGKDVSNFSIKNNMSPSYSDGKALFYYPTNRLTVSFGTDRADGNYYLIYYTFLPEK